MLKGSNCDRKSQFSEILTEPLNPRGRLVSVKISALEIFCIESRLQARYCFPKNNKKP